MSRIGVSKGVQGRIREPRSDFLVAKAPRPPTCGRNETTMPVVIKTPSMTLSGLRSSSGGHAILATTPRDCVSRCWDSCPDVKTQHGLERLATPPNDESWFRLDGKLRPRLLRHQPSSIPLLPRPGNAVPRNPVNQNPPVESLLPLEIYLLIMETLVKQRRLKTLLEFAVASKQCADLGLSILER